MQKQLLEEIQISHYGELPSVNLGIYREDERVFPSHAKNGPLYGSFKVNLLLTDSHWSMLDPIDGMNHYIFHGIYHGNISDFVVKETFDVPEGMEDFYDYEKLREGENGLKCFDREVFDYEALMLAINEDSIARANMRFLVFWRDSPEPVIYPGKTLIGEDTEFLQFHSDDTWMWAPPLTYEGKKGCVAKIKESTREFEPQKSLNVINRTSGFDLPIDGDPREKANTYYRMDDDTKLSLLMTLPATKRNQVLITALHSMINSLKESTPWRLILSGDDDVSWTKFFDTEEEAQEELKYLRSIQPLYRSDVVGRNYIFTN